MPDIYVVIPVYNHYDLTNKVLHKLMNLMSAKIKSVLVVNDASSEEETMQGLHWWKTATLPLTVKSINLEENVGFLLASNLGLKTIARSAQDDDIIILLSNDVEIYVDFTPELVEAVEGKKALAGGIAYWHDTGWNTFNGKTFPYVEGWLLATTVAGWKEIGYFDQRYVPNDFEDVVLSTKARSLGYTLVGLNHPGLKHIGGQSLGYTEERRKLTQINREKFEAKWVK